MDDVGLKPERRMKGVAVSRGLGVGNVVFLDRAPHRSDAPGAESQVEIKRFRRALRQSRHELSELIKEAGGNGEAASLLDFQLLILESSSLPTRVEDIIDAEQSSAEYAVRVACSESSAKQKASPDPHLSEKSLDIDDLERRLQTALHRQERPHFGSEIDGAVVAAFELRPAEVVEIGRHKPAGLVTERGGWTSHSCIIARELNIPMVSGIRRIDRVLNEGDRLLVDGNAGLLVFDPPAISSPSVVVSEPETLPETSFRRSTTKDGVDVTIRANVDMPEAYPTAHKFGARGIGLFRSESLIVWPGDVPDEEDQTLAYSRIAEVAGEDGVRIRTFDVGRHRLTGLHDDTEINPALGLRSIRLALDQQTHFRCQVRAILRASVAGNIDILIPMVSGVEEMELARKTIEEEANALREQGVEIGAPRLGAMIEVPSAVFLVNEIAAVSDFLALGTNDLVQYTLAVDRDNEMVADWYRTLHPSIIRSLRKVLSAARKAEKQAVVCGEMAGSHFYVPLLLALGARELSMNINSIRSIRRLISEISLDVFERCTAVDELSSADEIEEMLRQLYAEHWPDSFPKGSLNAKHR